MREIMTGFDCKADIGATPRPQSRLVVGMKWAKDEGCEWFDVEGYDENTIQTSPLYGFSKFKGQFRPQPIEIVAEHVGVCHWPKYALHQMSHSWRRLLNVRRKLLAWHFKIRL